MQMPCQGTTGQGCASWYPTKGGCSAEARHHVSPAGSEARLWVRDYPPNGGQLLCYISTVGIPWDS